MRWCCNQFHGWLLDAGLGGISIIVDQSTDGDPVFIMQARVVEHGKEIQISSPEGVPVYVVSEVWIVYCPWCGKNLLKWYGKNIIEFARKDLKITMDNISF